MNNDDEISFMTTKNWKKWKIINSHQKTHYSAKTNDCPFHFSFTMNNLNYYIELKAQRESPFYFPRAMKDWFWKKEFSPFFQQSVDIVEDWKWNEIFENFRSLLRIRTQLVAQHFYFIIVSSVSSEKNEEIWNSIHPLKFHFFLIKCKFSFLCLLNRLFSLSLSQLIQPLFFCTTRRISKHYLYVILHNVL